MVARSKLEHNGCGRNGQVIVAGNGVTVEDNAIDNQHPKVEFSHHEGQVVIRNGDTEGLGISTGRRGEGAKLNVRKVLVLEGHRFLEGDVDIVDGGIGVVDGKEDTIFRSNRSTGGIVGYDIPIFHGFRRRGRTRRSRNRRDNNWSRNRNCSRNWTGNRDWSRNWNMSRSRSRNRNDSRIWSRNWNWNKR